MFFFGGGGGGGGGVSFAISTGVMCIAPLHERSIRLILRTQDRIKIETLSEYFVSFIFESGVFVACLLVFVTDIMQCSFEKGRFI